jgi:hypothetical protein
MLHAVLGGHNQAGAIGKDKSVCPCSKRFAAELSIQVQRVVQGKPPPLGR